MLAGCWVNEGTQLEACKTAVASLTQILGACFSHRMFSDAVTCPISGLGKSLPGAAVTSRASGPQAGWLGVGAPLAQGSLYSADLRPQLITLMGLNGPQCSQGLDRTHLEPAGGLAPADSERADLSVDVTGIQLPLLREA